MKKLFYSIIILGLATYNFKLYIGNDLAKYINPRYTILSLSMSLVSILFGLIILENVYTNRKKISKELKTVLLDLKSNKTEYLNLLAFLLFETLLLWQKLYLISFLVFIGFTLVSNLAVKIFDHKTDFLLVFILIVGLGLPARTLSTEEFGNRIGDLNNVSASVAEGKNIKFSFNTENYSMTDWIIAFNTNPNPANFQSKKIKLSGFVYGKDKNHFLLSRFVLRCCAADATPTGILVSKEGWESEYEDGDWLLVQGEFNVASDDQILIIPNSIEVIDEPADPYISGI